MIFLVRIDYYFYSPRVIAFFPLLTHGSLTEDGICSNGQVSVGNEPLILNQPAADYIKNLTMDNRPLAEMMCHAMLNETTKKIR